MSEPNFKSTAFQYENPPRYEELVAKFKQAKNYQEFVKMQLNGDDKPFAILCTLVEPTNERTKTT